MGTVASPRDVRLGKSRGPKARNEIPNHKSQSTNSNFEKSFPRGSLRHEQTDKTKRPTEFHIHSFSGPV